MTSQPAASVDIDAPLDLVWQVMLDTAAYGDWNPFVHRVDCGRVAVGEPVVLHVRWANGRTTRSPERISVLEEPWVDTGVRRALLAYTYEGVPARLGLVRGTRYQRLSQTSGRPTRYETVEEFSGPLVPLAGPDRVAEGFRRHAEALKETCEHRAR